MSVSSILDFVSVVTRVITRTEHQDLRERGGEGNTVKPPINDTIEKTLSIRSITLHYTSTFQPPKSWPCSKVI